MHKVTNSPGGFFDSKDFVIYIQYNGSFTGATVNNGISVRPTIILKSNVSIARGNGTLNNLYVVG